ncbi:MAG: hypothetical protein AB1424_14595 [Thermodesulfobacteriota bacterium]
MKRLSGTLAVWLVTWLLLTALLAVSRAWAEPTTPEQARIVVHNWLGLNARPLGALVSRNLPVHG